MNRAVFASLSILCLLSISSITGFIQVVKADSGTVYIRADGSIDPLTAPLFSADNITYTLTGNITADAEMGIVIERSHIVVDGAFYTIKGTGVEGAYGIYWCGLVKEISNVTIGNMTINAFSYGISLVYSPFCTISGNNITNNGAGLYLDSDSVTVYGNNITNNGNGIQVIGSNQNIFGNNITNNKDGISLQSSSNNNISENNITNNVSDNRLEGNGIFGLGSNLNNVTGNNITNNGNGIDIEYLSDCNTISGNNIATNRWADIYTGYSSNNSISNNKITNSQIGININTLSNFNDVFGNNISNNNYSGIYLERSSTNSFFHNSFVNNSAQALVDSGSVGNTWDDGYPSGGNYWSDYNGTDLVNGIGQNETGSDGIGDTSYIADANDRDQYPLMGMFHSFNVSWVDSGYFVDLISNSTISGFDVGVLILNPYTRVISFNVTGENDTVGFCRILIPTALMNGTYTIFVNGTEVPSNLLQCSNSTHSYLYFNYTHSTQEVIIIPEFPSFLILPLFFMATLLAVVVFKRKHASLLNRGQFHTHLLGSRASSDY